ncbi:DUF6455 family protein [Lutimaribacter sp. EGI FJ00015]|uniref:DUF6455 family protein n=1 Tax=Lutimaribacter degradans TaxID=2945989 RepID=A0ACC5ZTH4_9RHOB|nr:DUF6455 family protein [Lutimaribacter sp. EGI FJ00013]MCM2561587.1 DUF6455 family protein [Lutimaribacter sp. EGI FJ00013]MCO0612702.1 DUF6455 family protein [Lutimaribacter sp. EGI FJ00015]MCO0635360.1 DUF6455 family protein [Lutimaribacter sp. EGI FJ00014]
MSGALNTLLVDFRYRQRVRHAMFDHMGIDIPEEDAKRLFEHLRAAMLACNRCQAPETCINWINGGHRGAPHFCKAHTALMVLQRATGQASAARHAAE